MRKESRSRRERKLRTLAPDQGSASGGFPRFTRNGRSRGRRPLKSACNVDFRQKKVKAGRRERLAIFGSTVDSV